MGKQFVCFWCRQTFPRVYESAGGVYTKDHIKPRCMGGAYTDENLRDCCNRCNQDRGLITAVWGRIRCMESRLAQWESLSWGAKRRVLRGIKSLHRDMPQILAHQRKWVALEIERLGYAPSGIPLIVPVANPIRQLGTS